MRPVGEREERVSGEHGADRVVPELQDRGVFRADYEHETLRGHLGLAPINPTASPTLSSVAP